MSSWRIARSTPLVAGWCQPGAICPWMVPTDTHGRSGDMGDRCAALTWPGAGGEDRPDWPSGRCQRHWPNVWCECSSLSTHCTKVRGSTSVGTILHKALLDRPSGRTEGAIRHEQDDLGAHVARWRIVRCLETPLWCVLKHQTFYVNCAQSKSRFKTPPKANH